MRAGSQFESQTYKSWLTIWATNIWEQADSWVINILEMADTNIQELADNLSHKNTRAGWQFETQKYKSWLTIWVINITRVGWHKHTRAGLQFESDIYESLLTICITNIRELADNTRAGWQFESETYKSWLTIWENTKRTVKLICRDFIAYWCCRVHGCCMEQLVIASWCVESFHISLCLQEAVRFRQSVCQAKLMNYATPLSNDIFKTRVSRETVALPKKIVIIMGYPAPQNPWRFEIVSNASQTPECLYVPECLRAGPLQPIQAVTLKQLQLFLPFLNAYSTLRIYGPQRYSTHDTLVSQ